MLATTQKPLLARSRCAAIKPASAARIGGVVPRATSSRCSSAFLAASSSFARPGRFGSPGCTAATRASQSVWSRRPPSAVHSDNRGEDDGGTTQITALLVLSLMLLSLPWALEHPAVLLVPVVLSTLPGVGPSFIQPIFQQALVWVIACCRWLPRLAKAAFTRQQQQQPQHTYQQRRTAGGPRAPVNPGPRPAAAAAMPRVHHSPLRQSSHAANILDNLDQL